MDTGLTGSFSDSARQRERRSRERGEPAFETGQQALAIRNVDDHSAHRRVAFELLQLLRAGVRHKHRGIAGLREHRGYSPANLACTDYHHLLHSGSFAAASFRVCGGVVTIHSGGIFSSKCEFGHFDDDSRQVDDIKAYRQRSGTADAARSQRPHACLDFGEEAVVVSHDGAGEARRLEREGVIAGYGVRLSEAYVSGLIQAHVLITIAPKALAQVVAALERVQAVTTLHSVSGSFDLIAIIAAPSIVELDRAIDEIGTLQGVERTMSLIVLSTRIARRLEMNSDIPGTEGLKLLDEAK